MNQEKKNPLVTVDIIIEIAGRGIVLIERKNPPHGWALPGGFVDYGESLEHAAVRERQRKRRHWTSNSSSNFTHTPIPDAIRATTRSPPSLSPLPRELPEERTTRKLRRFSAEKISPRRSFSTTRRSSGNILATRKEGKGQRFDQSWQASYFTLT